MIERLSFQKYNSNAIKRFIELTSLLINLNSKSNSNSILNGKFDLTFKRLKLQNDKTLHIEWVFDKLYFSYTRFLGENHI